jgi:predicted NBD/HSP70 family sugar kinase
LGLVPKPDDVPILIRRTHEERILATLRECGPLTRAELEERVGLSRTTLSDITAALLRRGALVEREADSGARGRGRPATRLALDPASGQFLGVDLGHRQVHVAIVNASNEVIAAGGRSYSIEEDWSARLDLTFELIDELAASAGLGLGALEGIGVGIPGPAGPALRDDSTAPPRWRGLSREAVIEMVHDRFGVRFTAPIVADNNTRYAALGEAIWGPSPETDSLLYLRLSDGVGGGLVVGGRLVGGAFGAAGELGHITTDPSGAPCWCGKNGCLETVASVPSVFARAGMLGADPAELDPAAPAFRRAVREAGEATGWVLATAAGAIDPREVVVAGDMLRFPDFFAAVRETFDRDAPPVAYGSRLRVSALSEQAGALGAIAAAFHRSPLLAGYAGSAAPARAAFGRRQA